MIDVQLPPGTEDAEQRIRDAVTAVPGPVGLTLLCVILGELIAEGATDADHLEVGIQTGQRALTEIAIGAFVDRVLAASTEAPAKLNS